MHALNIAMIDMARIKVVPAALDLLIFLSIHQTLIEGKHFNDIPVALV